MLRFGELFQTGISLFMIGYLEVAHDVDSLFYAIGLTLLPFGLGLGAILFMSVVLGFITAVPKIGGILCMFVGGFLMLTNLEPGLGWFGFTVVSASAAIFDMLIRVAMMMVVAKLMGVLEAYSATPPRSSGERLGMTKMQIIATVIIWALGAGLLRNDLGGAAVPDVPGGGAAGRGAEGREGRRTRGRRRRQRSRPCEVRQLRDPVGCASAHLARTSDAHEARPTGPTTPLANDRSSFSTISSTCALLQI